MKKDFVADGAPSREYVQEFTAPNPVRNPFVQGPRAPYLVMMSGGQTGWVSAIGASDTIGSGTEATIQLLGARGVSPVHAILTSGEGVTTIASANATSELSCNGVKVERAQLHDGDKVGLGSEVTLRFNLFDKLEADAQRSLYEGLLKETDVNAFNRRYLEERLFAEVAYASRHNRSFVAIMIEAEANDEVRAIESALVEFIVKQLRTEDMIARWDGPRFIVLAHGLVTAQGTMLAERLGRAINAHTFGGKRIKVRVGLVVHEPQDEFTIDALVATLQSSLK